MLMDTRMRGWRASGGRPPPSEPRLLTERHFRRGEVPAVRRFAEAFGARAGIGPARLPDFVLAVNEAAACATAWRPGTARVRLWASGSRAFCEVRGDARVLRRTAPATARRGVPRPDGLCGEEDALRRRVLKQVCDYVSVASGQDGVQVLLSMSVSGRKDDRAPRPYSRLRDDPER
jgi:hypothetical protein